MERPLKLRRITDTEKEDFVSRWLPQLSPESRRAL